ncbi:hypothetical protein QUF74_05555 [Candidatus Halobeggiatoa sp. HSG11]|nr:hypothetical protein [Candidatus Halobeggiatoa sp. HSG11]
MNGELFDLVAPAKITNVHAYPAPPGSACNAFKCKQCKHICRVGHDSGKSHLKCDIIKQRWTTSCATDIQAKSPACRFFEMDLNRG